MTAHRFFATTFKGLEEVLSGEVAALGGEGISIGAGSVSFSGDMTLCYRANLWLRAANRVVMLLSEFPAPTPAALYKGTREIPWHELFPPARTFAVDATVRGAPGDAAWSESESLLVEMCDRLHRDAALDDALLERMHGVWKPEQILELLVLAGLYHAVSFVTNGARVELEPGAPRFPS